VTIPYVVEDDMGSLLLGLCSFSLHIKGLLTAVGHLSTSWPTFFIAMARRDHPEDFNAFGYDPRGRVANFTGLMFGENWRPEQQYIPRFDGPQITPPRFGPAAEYQYPHLPENFIPHLPHDGYLGALQYQRREGPWASYLKLFPISSTSTSASRTLSARPSTN
jgi:hypothetical protein